jgi:MFS family permease
LLALNALRYDGIISEDEQSPRIFGLNESQVDSMSYWRLLRRNPEYAKLWIAQVISLTGDWFNTIVLLGLVNEYSGGSGIALSIFWTLRAIPPLIIAPVAGVLLDRFNRRNVLVASNLLRALIVPLFLLANSPDRLWIIYVVTVAQFTLSAFFEPGQTAIIPSLMQPDDIVEGNTLFSITWSVMLAVGAMVGGIFAYYFGTTAALIADAVTFAIAGALILWVDDNLPHVLTLHNRGSAEAPVEDTSFMEGLRYLRRTPQMLAAIFVKFGLSLTNVDILLTVFATQVFVIGARGEISQAILWSALGFGAWLGPVLTNLLNDGSVKQMRRLIGYGFLLALLTWPLLAWSPGLGIVAFAVFIRAMGGSINWTYSNVIIQKTAPDAKLGRMFSLDWFAFHLAVIAASLTHGTLIDNLGVERVNWIIWGTMLVALLPVLIWYWIVPRLEAMEAQDARIQVAPLAGD